MQSSAVCTFQTWSCYNLDVDFSVNANLWPNFLIALYRESLTCMSAQEGRMASLRR